MNCANHPDRERVAFCQNCGKPICQECMRTVGSAVFCEPCLAAKLAGADAPPAGGPYTYPAGDRGYNYTASGAAPPPPIAGEPNPGLAALLGFIPGVGAMYNGQYAKGIVHLIVFAILVSLSHETGIFGLFVAGWVFYQVFEAHQTARARRDGTPLPNPFGLNDLGERLGFGKAWPGTPAQPGTAAESAAAPAPGGPVAGAAGYPPPYSPPYAAPFTAPASASWNSWESQAAPQPAPPYGAPVYPVDPHVPYVGNRFPSGAIWLIALGAIFLLGNSGLFHGFSSHWFLPFLLIGLGVWQFVRRMTEFGAPLADDGTALYRVRMFHALRGSVWIILVGVLFLLDSFHILSWGRSWPLFIIVAGLMAILHRTTLGATAAPYPYAPPQTPPPASNGTSAVSPDSSALSAPSHMLDRDTHDQEGS